MFFMFSRIISLLLSANNYYCSNRYRYLLIIRKIKYHYSQNSESIEFYRTTFCSPILRNYTVFLYRINLAGLPATIAQSGTFLVTTEPAPIIE